MELHERQKRKPRRCRGLKIKLTCTYFFMQQAAPGLQQGAPSLQQSSVAVALLYPNTAAAATNAVAKRPMIILFMCYSFVF
jgi:hypothetical protein